MITLFQLAGIYLAVINIVSGMVFGYDKHAAKNNNRRIPELTLHIFEMAGGVFTNIALMYAIRHKNRKFGYYVWTWMVLIGWVGLIYMLLKHANKGLHL